MTFEVVSVDVHSESQLFTVGLMICAGFECPKYVSYIKNAIIDVRTP